MRQALVLIVALLASSVPAAPTRDSLDAAARDYVRLQLAIGEKEDGYIDAYYGPEQLKAEGKALAAHPIFPRSKTRRRNCALAPRSLASVPSATARAAPASSPRS